MSDQEFNNGVELPVMSLANDEVIEASVGITVREAATILDNEAIGLLLLRDGTDLAGVISERDIVRAVATGADLDAPATSVASDRELLWAKPTSSIGDVALEMMESYVRHVLIAGDDGQPAGIVSMRDLLATIIE